MTLKTKLKCMNVSCAFVSILHVSRACACACVCNKYNTSCGWRFVYGTPMYAYCTIRAAEIVVSMPALAE